MLLVKIFVNQQEILRGTAVRIKGGTHPDDINTYQLHDGTILKHRYGDGATKLAQKILKRRLMEWEDR